MPTTEFITFFVKTFLELWNFSIAKIDNQPITVGTLVLGLVFLFIGITFSKFLSRKISNRLLTRTSMELSVRHTVESIMFYLLAIIFILFAMKMANLPITIFTVLGGALAIGVGFGSQNIVNNFISGIILMIERPIKVGDYIEVDGVFGYVQDLGMRSTVIRSFGNKHIVVPNSNFLEKPVVNWTHQSDHRVRLTVRVGVAYGSPTDKVRELLTIAAKEEARTLGGQEPLVLFQDFGDSALIFEVFFWIHMRELLDQRIIESNIRYKIDDLFRQNGITIPFPQRDVHLYRADNAMPISSDHVKIEQYT